MVFGFDDAVGSAALAGNVAEGGMLVETLRTCEVVRVEGRRHVQIDDFSLFVLHGCGGMRLLTGGLEGLQ